MVRVVHKVEVQGWGESSSADQVKVSLSATHQMCTHIQEVALTQLGSRSPPLWYHLPSGFREAGEWGRLMIPFSEHQRLQELNIRFSQHADILFNAAILFQTVKKFEAIESMYVHRQRPQCRIGDGS